MNYNATSVTLEVAPEEAIAGLTAVNNSPTPLDSLTALTAAVTAGRNVSYAWNFGDGTTATGAVANHTYAAPGVYTAEVTATNAVTTLTDTTSVIFRPASTVEEYEDGVPTSFMLGQNYPNTTPVLIGMAMV